MLNQVYKNKRNKSLLNIASVSHIGQNRVPTFYKQIYFLLEFQNNDLYTASLQKILCN